MKKVLVLFILAICTLGAFAQVPQAFKYQAVIRDASDNVIANTSVDVRITIANSVPTDVYSETHTVTTSMFGLVNLNVGEGTPVTGTFNTIDWSADTYTIGVEVDAGSGYEDLGSSDLLSVPYALHAMSVEGGWTVSGNDIYNSNSGFVGIGDDFNGYYGKVYLNIDNPNNALTNDSVNGMNVALNISDNNASTGDAIGLKFSATGTGNYGGGAAIIHERTGAWSQGKLHFATKGSILNDSIIPIRMTIDENGKVGIGTTSPLTNFTIQQTAFTAFDTPGEAGITLYNHNNASQWTIYNSTNYLSFAFLGTRVAYVSESTGAWNSTSDRRLKENIIPMNSVLGKVMQLEPVSYDFIGRKNSHTIGFIAQDVEPLFPEVVSKDDKSEESYYGIAYGNMSIIAIKAIQEQQVIIEDQQTQINDLQKQIDELRQLIIAE
ncbi:MAG: tail fiber domain-containing protein [Bacteroidales bacterium]|nr:tail fiber domain-containing protein [Bacteroidales bacterium]